VRMQWSGHVARMGRQGMHTEFWYGTVLETEHFVDQIGED